MTEEGMHADMDRDSEIWQLKSRIAALIGWTPVNGPREFVWRTGDEHPHAFAFVDEPNIDGNTAMRLFDRMPRGYSLRVFKTLRNNRILVEIWAGYGQCGVMAWAEHDDRDMAICQALVEALEKLR